MNMAKSMDLNPNIVGVFTSPPSKITDTRLSYKISFSNDQISNGHYDPQHGIMQNWMHIILWYQNQSKEDSGWHVGGWVKASLGNALSDHPFLAGRLRRSENGDLEIVSNDSGVRCVEAEVQMSLKEFLQSKGNKKSDVESKLVYWEDVDEPNLQFSPLFCIQVTNFKCGGYTIGISYHLLLADTSFMAKFLNKWAESHRSIAYEDGIQKIPFFNLKNGYSLPNSASKPISHSNAKYSKTMLFDIFTYEKFKSGDEVYNYFILLCLEELESNYGNKISSDFTLLTRDLTENVTINVSSKRALSGSPKNMKYEFNNLNLDNLGVNEIAFLKGNGPMDASHWISCDALEVMVIVVISPPSENKYGMKVYVTIPRV